MSDLFDGHGKGRVPTADLPELHFHVVHEFAQHAAVCGSQPVVVETFLHLAAVVWLWLASFVVASAVAAYYFGRLL